jgi:hypothetical protein
VNPVEAHHIPVPSRRNVLDAFERLATKVAEQDDGELYVGLAQEFTVLRLYLATR